MCLCEGSSTPGPTWQPEDNWTGSVLSSPMSWRRTRGIRPAASTFGLPSHLASPQQDLVFVDVHKFLKLKSVPIQLYLALRRILYTYPGSIHHCSINFIKCFTKCNCLALYGNRLLKRPSQSMAPGPTTVLPPLLFCAVREGRLQGTGPRRACGQGHVQSWR